MAHSRHFGIWLLVAGIFGSDGFVGATPANKAALERYYGAFLPSALRRCTTCHLPSNNPSPESLEEFPHNAFGSALRALRTDAPTERRSISARLEQLSLRDSDGDGADNIVELLSGHNPGDAADAPSRDEQAATRTRQEEFRKSLAAYSWRPFDPLK